MAITLDFTLSEPADGKGLATEFSIKVGGNPYAFSGPDDRGKGNHYHGRKLRCEGQTPKDTLKAVARAMSRHLALVMNAEQETEATVNGTAIELRKPPRLGGPERPDLTNAEGIKIHEAVYAAVKGAL